MNPDARADPTASKRGDVEISRDFDFPREAVFDMCASPEKAAKWFLAPEGGTTVLFELDARPGGTVRIDGHHGDGKLFRTTGTFLEFVVPERIVVRTATTPPWSTVPFEALQTLVFEALGPARTRVTVRVKVLTAGSFPGGAEELAEGFLGGWGGTLNLLRKALG